MHKHFRMIAILNFMREHSSNATGAQLWAKLRSMYDLPGLDEQDESEAGDEEDPDKFVEFAVPYIEFSSVIEQHRRESSVESGPPVAPTRSSKRKRRASVDLSATESPAEDTDAADTEKSSMSKLRRTPKRNIQPPTKQNTQAAVKHEHKPSTTKAAKNTAPPSRKSSRTRQR